MNKLFRWKTLYLLCAGVMSLGIFSACSDDIDDALSNQAQTQQIEPLESYIGKVNMAIEATVVPIGSDAARLQYILGPRDLKKAVHGSTFRSPTGSSADPYKPEDGTPLTNEPNADLDNASYNDHYLAPFLSIGAPKSKIPGYLVFIYDDVMTTEKIVHRQAVNFEVVETVKLVEGTGDGFHGGYKLEGQNRVRFTGDINFPESMTLNKAFENGTTQADEVTPTDANFPINADFYNKNIKGHGAVLRKSKWKVQAYLGYSDEGGTDNKVYFGTDKTQKPKTNSTATAFAPKINDHAELHTPCISEWTELYIAGAPDHVGDKTQYTGINSTLKFKPQGLLLQYDVDVEMFDPTYVRSAGLISNGLTFAGYYDLSDESIRTAYQKKDTETKGVPEFNEILKPTMDEAHLMLRYPKSDALKLTTETDPSKLMYPFYMPQLIDSEITGLASATGSQVTLEGTAVVSTYQANVVLGAGTELGSRKIFTFWAMPRKVKPQKPQTYMFLKTGEGTSADAGSQPTHLLHQTSKDFSGSKGRVVYAKGILNSNLIFSEIFCRQVPNGTSLDEDPRGNQEIYASLVELYNPMAYPVRLDNYYLVGMREGDGEMQFIQTPAQNPNDIELTTNLANAYLVPLKTLLYEDEVTNEENRAGSLFDANPAGLTHNFYVPSMGSTKALTLSGVGLDEKFHYLLPGQTLLIGGHFWFQYAQGSNVADLWYDNDLLPKLKKASSEDGGYQLKGLFYHANTDGGGIYVTSPLDLRPGDGVALVKVVDDKRYIIDATAPLPGKAKITFAGAFAEYSAETTPYAEEEFFVMTRNNKVNFPFIPPYRTQRLTGSHWSDDWTIFTDKNKFTPGWRGTAKTSRTWHNINGTWKRTPLAKWATYLDARPAKH